MSARIIKPGVYWVGAIDWERRLFDSLIPLPDGTSYNSYLVQGSQKTALIETVDSAKTATLLQNLEELGVTKIDYLVANHAEQDHTGSLPALMARYPEATVVTSPKCQPILIGHLQLPPERIVTVTDGQTLELGGKTLEFLNAPWVHWPETMLAYLKEQKILFPCDFLGSHLATSHLYATDEGRVYESAKRYFAEIMMPFRSLIQKHLTRLEAYQIEVIAPSHGPLYNRPAFILEAYRDWASDTPKNNVIIPFVSMHESTRLMAEYLVQALIKRDVTVQPFDLVVTDVGKLAESLVDAATVLIGTPTVLAGAHPQAAYAAILANALRPKVKFAGIFGSYGWGGQTVEQLKALIPNLKAELLEPVMVKGLPQPADYKLLDALAETIKQKHSSLGLA